LWIIYYVFFDILILSEEEHGNAPEIIGREMYFCARNIFLEAENIRRLKSYGLR